MMVRIPDWSTMPCPKGVGWRTDECPCSCHNERPNEEDPDPWCGECCYECEVCGKYYRDEDGDDHDCPAKCEKCGEALSREEWRDDITTCEAHREKGCDE